MFCYSWIVDTGNWKSEILSNQMFWIFFLTRSSTSRWADKEEERPKQIWFRGWEDEDDDEFGSDVDGCWTENNIDFSEILKSCYTHVCKTKFSAKQTSHSHFGVIDTTAVAAVNPICNDDDSPPSKKEGKAFELSQKSIFIAFLRLLNCRVGRSKIEFSKSINFDQATHMRARELNFNVHRDKKNCKHLLSCRQADFRSSCVMIALFTIENKLNIQEKKKQL